jgi:hypothetical protein
MDGRIELERLGRSEGTGEVSRRWEMDRLGPSELKGMGSARIVRLRPGLFWVVRFGGDRSWVVGLCGMVGNCRGLRGMVGVRKVLFWVVR